MAIERLDDAARALEAAFPDRAAAYRRAVDRWAWLSGSVRGGACDLCGRAEIACSWRFEQPSLDGDPPAGSGMTLCGCCIVVLRERFDAPPDEMVLADVARALDETLAAELERACRAARPALERGGVPCDACRTDDLPRLFWKETASGVVREVCRGCLDEAAAELRIAARLPADPLQERYLARL